jgi:hypothetical protein
VYITVHKDVKKYTVKHCTLYASTKLLGVHTDNRNLGSQQRRYITGVVSDGHCLSTAYKILKCNTLCLPASLSWIYASSFHLILLWFKPSGLLHFSIHYWSSTGFLGRRNITSEIFRLQTAAQAEKNLTYRPFYMWRDRGGRVNILGSDSISHCEKKVHMNMCKIMKVYRKSVVLI